MIFPLAAADASGIWQLLATILLPLLVLGGSVACVAQMRRPGANLLGGLALLLGLLGGTLAASALLLRENLGRPGFLVLLLAGGLLAAAGLVCGGIGVALHGRMRFTEGRAAAAWGIALNVLLGAGGGVFFIGHYTAHRAAPAAPAADAASMKTLTFAEGNCQLSFSTSLWIESGIVARLDKETVLGLRCIRHDLMLAFSWVHDSEDASFHVRAGRNFAESKFPGLKTTSPVSERIGGLEFWHYEGTGAPTNSTLPRTISLWYASHGGTVYRIRAEYMVSGGQEALQEIRKVVATFALIDPAQQFIRPTPAPAPRPIFTQQPSPAPAKEGTSADFWAAIGKSFQDGSGKMDEATAMRLGFTTAIGPLGWIRVPENTGPLAAMPFHARLGLLNHFIGMSLPDDGGLLNIEDIRTLFDESTDPQCQNYSQSDPKPVEIPGAKQAVRTTAEFTKNGIRMRLRKIIALTDGRAFIFNAWQAINPATSERQLDDALATIRIAHGVEPLPPPAAAPARQLQSTHLHTLGVLASQRGEWPRALRLFQSAYRISQHNDLTIASIVACLDETGNPRKALNLLNELRDRVEKSAALRAARGRCRRLLGEMDGACEDFASALRDGHLEENDVGIYLACLLSQSKMAEAKKVADDFAAKSGTNRSRRLRASIHARAGDTEGALKLYEEILAKPPFDPVAAIEYGEIANGTGHYDTAAKAAADLLKAGNDSALTRLVEGWSHFGKKEWREAKVSFEKARTFQPNNEEIAAALLRASAMLGEGNNSSVKHPIPENEIPAATLAEIEEIAREAKPTKGANAWSPMRVAVISYRKGQQFSSTLHRRNHVADQSAVADFSTLNFAFDPLSQEIFVNRLTVTDESGNVIAKGVPEEQYLVDQSSQGPEATHGKILRVVVPGVKPGCTVEFAVTTRERAKAEEFPFQRNVVGTMHPVFTEAIVLRGDVGDVRAEPNAIFQKLAKRTEVKDTIIWLLREPPPWHLESLLPPVDEYMPVLSLGDRKADWKKEARDYLKQIGTLLTPDEDARKLALEITKGLTGNDEKIRALTRHVQRNVTYQAIEFGRRARIPKPAARSLSSHYGDCKDQALLLHHLLSSAGIESHLALVNSNTATVAALPSLDQFNHMIVRIPSLKSAFVDPTDSHLPAGLLAPAFFKHEALVLDAANPRLEALPGRSQFPAEHVGIESDISASADGAMQVKETVRISGYFATGLRHWLAEMQPSDRLASVQRWLTAERPQMHDVAIEALDQDEAELILKLQYTVQRGAASGRDGTVLPAILERQFIVHSFLKERHHPFDVQHPIVVDSRATLHTPTPPAAEAARSFSRSGKNDFCQWETKAVSPAAKDAPTVLTFHFESTAGIFPAGRYAEWQSACGSATEAWQTPLKAE